MSSIKRNGESSSFASAALNDDAFDARGAGVPSRPRRELVVLALASDKSPTEASNESAADIFEDVRDPDASPAPSSRSRNLTERPLLWLLEE